MKNIELQELIRELFHVRDELANLSSIEKIVSKSLEIAQGKISAQLASIFLFSKNGFYKRVGHKGFDKNKEPIPEDWFEEKYKAGEGFIGNVICTADVPSFGNPRFSRDLESEDSISTEIKSKYKDKLGILKTGIAVPLSGKHRTFGVLVVINKSDINKNILIAEDFLEEDLLLITILGFCIASAITNLRVRHETDLLDHISRMVLDPKLNEITLHKIYSYILQQLVDPLTYFCAAILWEKEIENKLSICAKATSSDKISWNSLNNTINNDAVTYPGLEFLIKDICIENNISENPDKFQLNSFINDNNLFSYFGIPIFLGKREIGIISLFTLFKCDIQDIDQFFLESVSSNIVMLNKSVELIRQLNQKDVDLRILTEKNFSKLRKKGYDLSLEEMLHKHKNVLTNISTNIGDLIDCSPGEKNRKLDKLLNSVRSEIEIIQKKLDDSTVISSINLNKLIHSEIISLKKTFGSSNLSFIERYDSNLPQLYIAEDKIQEAVGNILHNAIKAVRNSNRKEGIISVFTEIVPTRITRFQICIEDNGGGIRKEDINDIFDEGFTTEREGGTGMGLFFSKNIIESLGGEIIVDSTIGKGSTFIIRIPLKRYSESV